MVAESADVAYDKVRLYLEDGKIGFPYQRELKSVELLAEDVVYPDCGVRLLCAD